MDDVKDFEPPCGGLNGSDLASTGITKEHGTLWPEGNIL